MDSPLKVLYMKGRYGKSAAPFCCLSKSQLQISVFLQKQFAHLVRDLGSARCTLHLDCAVQAFGDVDGEPLHRLRCIAGAAVLYPLIGGGLRTLAGRLGADGDLLAHRAISINSAMTASISAAAGPVSSVS